MELNCKKTNRKP